MKIKLSGEIRSMKLISVGGQDWVDVELSLLGKVESLEPITAREAGATVTLSIKPLAAEQLYYGQEIKLEVDTGNHAKFELPKV